MTFESVFVWRSIGAQDGWSPLGYAAFNGHTRVVRMLLLLLDCLVDGLLNLLDGLVFLRDALAAQHGRQSGRRRQLDLPSKRNGPPHTPA